MKKAIPHVDGLHDSVVKKFIAPIHDILTNGVNDSKRVVFICGKDKADKESYRYKISKILEQHAKYQLAYPEDLFEDLLEGQANNSLLSLEAQLAEAVDLIILIPESPGSFAELGAFSMIKGLSAKMLVLRQGRYKSDKSFINHGPIRLVKSSRGKVMDLPNNFDLYNIDHFTPILNKIKSMVPHGRVSKPINNILLYNNHLLILIYLFDGLSILSIYRLFSLVLNKKLTNQEETGSRAAIHSLIKSRLIDREDNKFILTQKGFEEVQQRFYAIKKINDLRIQIMNAQMKNS